LTLTIDQQQIVGDTFYWRALYNYFSQKTQHSFYSPVSMTTWVSWYQNVKPSLGFIYRSKR